MNKNLPFSFAKRHGVLIGEIHDHLATVYHRPNVNYQSILEVRRFVDLPIQLINLSEELFNARLTEQYETQAQNSRATL